MHEPPPQKTGLETTAPQFSWKITLLVLCAGIIFALSFCELALRLLEIRFDASLFTNDTELGWALRPGANGWNVSEGEAFSQVNQFGQLDSERTLEKPPGVYRVAVLGDSMVEARQVALEKRFTQIAEREAYRCGRSLEVLNFGVPGYGTAQELLLLRSRVWQYKPDLVVLGVYFGNDLCDNHPALDYTSSDIRPYFRLRQGSLVFDDAFRKSPKLTPASIRRHDLLADVMNRSHLLMLLNQAMNSLRARGTPPANAAPGASGPNYVKEAPYLFPGQNHPKLAESWAVTEALLRMFRDEVQQHQTSLVLLHLPTTAQTHSDPAVIERFSQSLTPRGDIDYARKRLTEFAGRERIPLLDLTGPLQQYAMKHKIFVNGFRNTGPNDGHLNEHGHQVTGSVLAQFLCSMLKQ